MADQTGVMEPEATTQDTQEASRPSSYSPDNEPAKTVESEVETEEEVEQTEPSNEEPEKDKGHNWNVALQHVQQKQAQFDSKLDQISGQFEQLFKKLDGQKGAEQPAAKDDEATKQEARDDLEALFDDLKSDDPDDLVTAKAVKEALRKLAKATGAKTSDPQYKAMKEELDALREEQRALKQKAEAQADYAAKMAKLEQTYKFDCEPLWKKAMAEADKEYPDVSDEVFQWEANKKFQALLKEKVAAESGKGKTPGKTTAPAGKNPPSSTKGAQTVSTSASTGRSAHAAGDSKPPRWVPD